MRLFTPVLRSSTIPLIAFLTFAHGCAEPAWIDVVDMASWSLENPDGWPGGTEAPACPAQALTAEAGTIELDTNLCDWITARTVSTVSVRSGTALSWFIFHDPLAADEAATATLGISVGENTWSQEVAIPAAAGFFEVEVEADAAVQPEEAVRFHVHNHGSNTYNLGYVRAWQRP